MSKITAERLRELTGILQRYKAGKASLERRVLAAEDWWRLRNRRREAREGHGSPTGFQSESGWLHNVIVSKHADAMEAYPEPVILPREPGDARSARQLSQILPCILERDHFERTWSEAMWQKLKTGTAAYRVRWDPELLGGLGDIRVERVDLLDLFWEPGVGDIQRSRYVFCTHLEDEDLLQERYPQLKGRLRDGAFRATRFVYDDAVDLTGKATVIEAYYKRDGLLHYVRYVGDTVLESTEEESLPPAGEGAPVRTLGRMREEPDEETQPSSGSDPLPHPSDALRETASATFPRWGKAGGGSGLYAHGRYPFVLDPLFPVEGSPCGYGFVDLCRNDQTAIDLLRTALVRNALVGATPRFFARTDGGVNEEELLDLTRPLVHVTGDLGEESLREMRTAGLPAGSVTVLESTIRELRETSGNTETATGNIHSGVTAASAIAALQEASGKGSRDAIRASWAAFGEIVEMMIELVRQFYDLPRQFRILGEGGTEYLSWSNAALRPREQFLAGQSLGLTQPVFDVKVSAQKRSAWTRLGQNELAMELYRLGLFAPGNERQALGLLELMDFDGRDALMRRLEERSAELQRLRQLEDYRRLALALARRYRPDLAFGLEGGAGESAIGGLGGPLPGASAEADALGDPSLAPPGDPGAALALTRGSAPGPDVSVGAGPEGTGAASRSAARQPSPASAKGSDGGRQAAARAASATVAQP